MDPVHHLAQLRNGFVLALGFLLMLSGAIGLTHSPLLGLIIAVATVLVLVRHGRRPPGAPSSRSQ